MMAAIHIICLFRRPTVWLGLLLALVLAQPALAYKTERVCETTEPSLKAPAKKVCKTLLVMTDAQKAATGKKEEKKEEKKGGHH
jgi:hypothetical protein